MDSRVRNLEESAIKIRIKTLETIGHLGFGHLGGSLSIADLLAVLYYDVMKIDPANPQKPDRDYLVCSKGHAGPGLYAALALKGYFPMQWLGTLNQGGTHLPSHCDRNLTPGIDMTTGSLGQGSSLAVGAALGHRIKGYDNYTYLILGDGELQEGQVWEAAAFAAHQKLNHLIVFVDWNKKQLDGYMKDINDYSNIEERFKAFGFNTMTIDGHDVAAIDSAIAKCKGSDKPSCIVLNTIKGKGCPFCENMLSNHHVTVSKEQMEESLNLLSSQLERVVKA